MDETSVGQRQTRAINPTGTYTEKPYPSIVEDTVSCFLRCHNKKQGSPPDNVPEGSRKTAATYSPTCAVPSAWRGLTSLFGMGRGGTPAL